MEENSRVTTRQQRHQAKYLPAIHRQSSAIHRAIQDHDLKTVTLLLTKGERLCMADGLNCFQLAAQHQWNGFNFLRHLLDSDSAGLNSRDRDGRTLLMRFAYNSDHTSHLLSLGADPRLTNNEGENALHFALKDKRSNVKSLETLINAGLDPKLGPQDGSCLTYLVESGCDGNMLENAKCLIASGVDVLTVTRSGRTALSLLTERMLRTAPRKTSDMGKLLEVFLNMEQFCDYVPESHDLIFHPQIIFIHGSHFQKFGPDTLLPTFLKNKYPLRLRRVVLTQMEQDFELLPGARSSHCNAEQCMGLVAELVHMALWSDSLDQVESLVRDLLSHGHPLAVPGSISPLTVLFSMSLDDEPLVEKVARLFMDNGVHMGERIWDLPLPRDSMFIRENYFIPDALCVAFLSGHLTDCSTELRHRLLSHLPSSPLALFALLGTYVMADGDLMKNWTMILRIKPLAPLPPGSQALQRCTRVAEAKFPHHAKLQFHEMHRIVPSLQELCRDKVRQQLGQRAAQLSNGPDLPGLIKQLAPPGLRKFLLIYSDHSA